jgi:hypothetical protein
MASINQAQVEVLRSKFLQSLGQSKASFDTPVTDDIMAQYAKAFIDEANKNLNKHNTPASGAISDDLTFSVTNAGKQVIISVGYPAGSKAAGYYDFINKGVAGVGKPSPSPYRFRTIHPSKKHVAAIKQWLSFGKAKITATDVGKYGPTKSELKHFRFKDSNPTAYAVATAVKKKGIDATHFFDDALTSVFNKDFLDVVGKAIGADVRLQIHQAFKNN